MIDAWTKQQEEEGHLVRIPFPCKDCGANCGQCGTRFPSGYGLVAKEVVGVLEKKFPDGFTMREVEQYRVFLERYKGHYERLERDRTLGLLIMNEPDTREYECRDPENCEYHRSSTTESMSLGPYRSPARTTEVPVVRSRWARFRSRFRHIVWALLITIRGGFLTRWKFKCVYCQKRSRKLLHVWALSGPHASDEDEWFVICPNCRKIWEPSHHPLKSLRNGTR